MVIGLARISSISIGKQLVVLTAASKIYAISIGKGFEDEGGFPRI